jgi:hypothetical protein
MSVYHQGGNLVVSTVLGNEVRVLNVYGQELQREQAVSGETTFSGLPQGQLLIVKSGQDVAKIIL